MSTSGETTDSDICLLLSNGVRQFIHSGNIVNARYANDKTLAYREFSVVKSEELQKNKIQFIDDYTLNKKKQTNKPYTREFYIVH
jgi:hypothetical protein